MGNLLHGGGAAIKWLAILGVFGIVVAIIVVIIRSTWAAASSLSSPAPPRAGPPRVV
jgi:hypothetical protein